MMHILQMSFQFIIKENDLNSISFFLTDQKKPCFCGRERNYYTSISKKVGLKEHQNFNESIQIDFG